MSIRFLGLKAWHIAFFLFALIVCAIILAPVSLVVRATPGKFAYERAEGTIWRARFTGAKIGDLNAGVVDWRIDFGALAAGAAGARMFFAEGDINGDLEIWYGLSGVQRISANSLSIRGATPISPLLRGRSSFEALDVVFSNKACARAEGRLRSDVPEQSAQVFGAAGPVMTGAAICGDGELWLPLEGASGAERFRVVVALRQNGSARWQADVVAGSVEQAGALALLGFTAVPDEPYLRQTRAFRWLPV